MVETLSAFIKNAPFAAVHWKLEIENGNQEFYMQEYNKKANDLDPRELSDFLGEPYLANFSEAKELWDNFFVALETEETIQFTEFEHNKYRKEIHYFRIWIIPVGNDQIIIMYDDITDKKENIEYQSQIEALVDKLKMSNKELEQYAELASHDLKEPVRLIKSYFDLLKDRIPIEEDTTYMISVIDKNIARMEKMIEGVLSLSKIDIDDVELEPLDPKVIIDEALMLVDNSNIEIDIEEPLPSILGDEELMVRVVKNLISNAVKYRDQSKEKSILKIRGKKSNDTVKLFFRDNGIGISENFMENKLFGLFERENPMNPSSNGIGLALVKKKMLIQNGQVEAKSTKGEGTTFILKLSTAN